MKNFFKDYIELARTNKQANLDFVKNHKIGTGVLCLATFAVCMAIPYVMDKIEERKLNKEFAEELARIEEDENKETTIIDTEVIEKE